MLPQWMEKQKHWGGLVGSHHRIPGFSWPGLHDLWRIQIGAKLLFWNARLALDRQNKFRRDAPLRSFKPVPDLGLCGADAVSEPLLAAGRFTCAP